MRGARGASSPREAFGPQLSTVARSVRLARRRAARLALKHYREMPASRAGGPGSALAPGLGSERRGLLFLKPPRGQARPPALSLPQRARVRCWPQVPSVSAAGNVSGLAAGAGSPRRPPEPEPEPEPRPPAVGAPRAGLRSVTGPAGALFPGSPLQAPREFPEVEVKTLDTGLRVTFSSSGIND